MVFRRGLRKASKQQARQSSSMDEQQEQNPSAELMRSEPCVHGAHHDGRYKVVLIGDSMVGKSSILRCWRGERFEVSMLATIGLDFCARIYDLTDGRLRLDVWDTAGQERYGTITRAHYRDAKGLIFVYDIGARESFERIQRFWLNNVDEHVTEAVPIFIVGNKLDLAEDRDRRDVSTEEGRRFSELQSASGFFETSAKDGRGVLELFYRVATSMAGLWGLEKLTSSDIERMKDGRGDRQDGPIRLGDRAGRLNGEHQEFHCCRN